MAESKFEEIYAIRNQTYIVKRDNLFGIYDSESQEIIHEIEFQNMVFSGGSVVFAQKDKYWGVFSIDWCDDFKIVIPFKYLDVRLADNKLNYFWAVDERYVKDSEEAKDEKGNAFNLEKKYRYYLLDKKRGWINIGAFMFSYEPPIYLIENLFVVTEDDGKKGIVDLNKECLITPFKYDEISSREDSTIDVRVEERWGCLNGSGILTIPPFSEYKINPYCTDSSHHFEEIPEKEKGCLIKDEMEEYTEFIQNYKVVIPPVFKHLFRTKVKDYFAFSYEGSLDIYDINCVHCGSWGIIDKDLNLIIPPKFNSIAYYNGWFIGSSYEDMSDELEYDEDLFDYNSSLFDVKGTLIFSGFNKIIIEEKFLKLRFGGNWKSHYYDTGYNYNFEVRFDDSSTKWLILDYSLNSLIRFENNKVHQFKKGFELTIRQETKDGKTTNYWNAPLEIFSDSEPRVINGYLIYSRGNKEYNIFLETYNKIELDLLDHNCKYPYGYIPFHLDNKIGILYRGEILIPPEYVLITDPICNFVFAVKLIDRDHYKVFFIDITKPTEVIEAINLIEFNVLSKCLLDRKFYIYPFSNNVSNVVVPDRSIFDETFLSLISDKSYTFHFKGRLFHWKSTYFSIHDSLGHYSIKRNDNFPVFDMT